MQAGIVGTMQFRPAGAPAGSWQHTPWEVCALYDPYERVNVWSHGLPALAFAGLSVLAWLGCFAGGMPMVVYGLCAFMTQGSSALTHIWPDSHLLEKIDHVCILFTLLGTPLTAIMAMRPTGPYKVLMACVGCGTWAAFLPPLPRTCTFVILGAIMWFAYSYILNKLMIAQVLLNLIGGYLFVRNGGHERLVGLQDHHILHYCVTLASVLQVINLRKLEKDFGHRIQPL